MRPPLVPSHRAQVVAIVFAGLLLASTGLPLFSQASDHFSPLRRVDGQSAFSQPAGSDSSALTLPAASVLGSPTFVWMRGTQAMDVQLRYECQTATGGPAPLCIVGGTSGEAFLYFNVDENATAPDTSAACSLPQCVTLDRTSIAPTLNAATFSGSIPLSAFSDAVDGDFLTIRVRVPLGGQVPANGACGGSNCVDPVHTTGQPFYVMRVDKSVPTFTVQDPANANVFNTTADQWYLYSNANLTGGGATAFMPTITINVQDNATGAPLGTSKGSETACAATAHFCFWREGAVHNKPFAVSGSGHTRVISYVYTEDGESFLDNTSTMIHMRLRDLAAHRAGVEGAAGDLPSPLPDPQLWVIMDITPPELVDGHLLMTSGVQGPAGLGEALRLHVNATDVGADIDTPLQFLNVEARLVTDGNRTSDWQSIRYNSTLDHHFSADFRVPSDPAQWASGQAWAEVRVTDPVGLQTDVVRVPGNVTVDADFPTIVPLAPVDATSSSTFTRERDVEFRIRATDPGNADAWDGANTPNTDGLGIDLDEVYVHYRIGETGAQTSVRLLPRTAEDTFSVTRTFGDEDPIYYWFSASDFAGNVARYPGSGDPNIELNATANDGRFLLVHTDRIGPTITPAKDHTYLGGPDNPEFWFDITDAGVGVDPEDARLFWRLSGETEFRTVVLRQATVTEPVTDAQLSVFRGEIPRQEDGAELQWHVRARDLLENTGRLGDASSPRDTIIDLTPPTVTVNAPARSSDAIFNVTWTGTDDRSGVRDFTLQFRIAPAGSWVTVPERERTALTSYQVCAATDRTYEFRVSARDMVGNERAFPDTADARTIVEAPESCAEPPRVTLDAPADGATLRGDTEIRWRAISTTFPDELDLAIRITPAAGGSPMVLAEGLDLTGSHTWRTGLVAPNEPCFPDGAYRVAVVAIDPISLEGVAAANVTLDNDITAAQCEARNVQGGNGPGPLPGDFDPLYLLVVLAFTGLVAVFVVGMTRRW